MPRQVLLSFAGAAEIPITPYQRTQDREAEVPAVPGILTIPGTPAVPGLSGFPGLAAGEVTQWRKEPGASTSGNVNPLGSGAIEPGRMSFYLLDIISAGKRWYSGSSNTEWHNWSNGFSHVEISVLDTFGTNREEELLAIPQGISFYIYHTEVSPNGLVFRWKVTPTGVPLIILYTGNNPLDAHFVHYTVDAKLEVYNGTDWDEVVLDLDALYNGVGIFRAPGASPNTDPQSQWNPTVWGVSGIGGGTPEQHVEGGITYHPPFTRTGSIYSVVNPPAEDNWHYAGTVRNPDDPSGFTTTIETADDLVPVQILTQEFYGDNTFEIRLHPTVEPPLINDEFANVIMMGSNWSVSLSRETRWKFTAGVIRILAGSLSTVIGSSNIPVGAVWGQTISLRIQVRQIIPDSTIPAVPPSPAVPPFGGTAGTPAGPDTPAVPGIPGIPAVRAIYEGAMYGRPAIPPFGIWAERLGMIMSHRVENELEIIDLTISGHDYIIRQDWVAPKDYRIRLSVG